MFNPIAITLKDARKLTLGSQGLAATYDSSLAVINQLTYVQIDTISVTERAHNHVVFSRNPQFHPKEFNQLMDEKKIFEYWSHAAAYLPIKDFRYSLFTKEKYKQGNNHWFPRDKKVEKYVLDQIKNKGPSQSKDFENPRNKNHKWYEWKPAKIALTNLFMDGSLMICNRKGFQKVFDLTENVIPQGVDVNRPNIKEYCMHLIFNAIKSHGLVSLNEICYLRKGVKLTIKKLLNELVEHKKIVCVQIISSPIEYFTIPEFLSSSNSVGAAKKVSVLSPFDNILIQRKRIKNIFNFDYQIECYVPEKKRKFGYYSLPVLYGDQFVARFDAKADRKTKIFTVKGLWFENGFHPSDDFYLKFSRELQSYSVFCGCESIKIDNVYPTKYKRELITFI